MTPGKLKPLLPFPLPFLLVSLALPQFQEAAIIMKTVDGDTFRAKYQGKEQKVRLIGMDTPEVSYNPKGKKDMPGIQGTYHLFLFDTSWGTR